MKSGPFFDTNILLYSLSGDERKAQIAHDLLRAGGHISVQVCNEFTRVAMQKWGLRIAAIRTALEAIVLTCEVHPLSWDTYLHALSLHERYGFPIYDAHIVASARTAGCVILYSEDFQDGLKVEGRLTVRNPFA